MNLAFFFNVLNLPLSFRHRVSLQRILVFFNGNIQFKSQVFIAFKYDQSLRTTSPVLKPAFVSKPDHKAVAAPRFKVKTDVISSKY